MTGKLNDSTMRKIDKSELLATKYKKWLDDLATKGKNHPKYNSSDFKYYYDIVANLVWLQAGLCAYSEKQLQDHRKCGPEHWIDGRFNKFPFGGQLDHYDSTLKTKKGWDWDNFFLADSDLNMKHKRENRPHGVLKPDMPDFDPNTYLEYKLPEHIFVPNRNLDFETQEKVLHDLTCLGLNFEPIIDTRKSYLAEYLTDIEYQAQTAEQVREKLYQFFTAFEMAVVQVV